MGWLPYERYAAEFAAQTASLGDVVSAVDPAAPVPTCPEWTVRDLVTHVGTGHRWVAGIVARRLTEPAPYVLVEAPAEPGRWADWLAEGAGSLIDAVRDVGHDALVWTWQADRTAGFWVRRMLHDEIVHRFDAELIAGRLGDLAPDLAADGVSDMLTTVETLSRAGDPRVEFARLTGSGERLRLHATDPSLHGAGDWLIERTPGGVIWRLGTGPAAVRVSGPARELLLVLNRRLEPAAAGLRVEGEAPLFTHWLTHSRF